MKSLFSNFQNKFNGTNSNTVNKIISSDNSSDNNEEIEKGSSINAFRSIPVQNSDKYINNSKSILIKKESKSKLFDTNAIKL